MIFLAEVILRRAWLLALLLSLGLCPWSVAAPPRPNVIFILADDLGYGDLGCFGQKLIQTPHLDRLAAEGMRFTHAYAGAAVCAPSRCSLMTGKHNGHAFIRGNKEIQPEGQVPMAADTFTVAHLMKQAGYATGIIGKWGLGPPESASVPNKMGFDSFFGYNCQRQAHEYYPQYMWRNNEKVLLHGQKYSHDLMGDEALQFVRQHQREPFFLYLAFTIPHSKLQVPDLGPYANASWPDNLKKLAAMITRLDRDVGRLMALLKELKLDEQTLVLFASDNGAAYNDALFHHSGPLRGRKRDLYEGGIRTPAIARWPGRIKAGVVSEQVWAFWDFLPTVAELTGQKAPAGMDGISILPVLLEGRRIEHPPLYWEFHQGGFVQAARMGDWKAVRLGLKKPIELYDLKTDAGEQHDVAAQHPDVVKRFQEYLKTARVDSEIWPIREKVERKAPKTALDAGAGGAPDQRTVEIQRGYSIPLIDLAGDKERQVIVDRQSGQYLGHPTTVLLEDGKTMLAVYPKGHGRGAIVLKRSSDGGRTWSERLPTRKSWETSLETPTIHRVIDAQGTRRLILFSGLYPIRLAVSADDGKSWSELLPVGDFGGIVAMASVERLQNGHYLALFHDDGRFFRVGGKPRKPPVFTVYKTISKDGGLTWGTPEAIATHAQAHLCEPGLIRSPDGKQIAVLLRENSRKLNSFVIFADDEGTTWSRPRELPGALTGDRHVGRYAPDGRLFITFRDTTHQSPTKGDWVAWVGTYDDILHGREGQYRVRLMKNYKGADCAYPGLELLPDGTFVTTTYGHWIKGEQPFVVSVRLTLKELDERAAQAERPSTLIERIQLDTVRSGFTKTHCWVHPRAGVVPGANPVVVLTMQELLLSGSDVFGPLHEMRTPDLGKTWLGPTKHSPSLGRRQEPGGIEVGVCDFTPAWHARTGKLLGIGQTVRYKGDRIIPDPRRRETAYAVYDAATHTWSEWDVVRMPDMDNKFFHAGAGSAQRYDLANGDVLIPIYFSDGRNPHRAVAVMRCRFDGKQMTYVEHGSEHTIPTHRGCLEPSLTKFGDRYFLTIRHGDGHGYVATSQDGLHFTRPQAWRWDDGSALGTGDTQQHWVTHSNGLFLAFTYKRADNGHVFRQRAPLFLAQVDPDRLTLKRQTLQVLVPERGARLGNFAVVNVSPRETWVTVAEWMQPVGCEKYGSDNSVYAARILWSQPNRLVAE